MNQFLFSPTKQFIYPSGKILVGGKIYVFIKHTNTLATLYNDEGVEIANPVVLDSNGRATVLADENYDYKLDVYTSDDELLFTAASYMTDQYERDLAIISTDGSVSITPSVSGYTDVWDLSVYESIKGATSGKFDTSAFEDFYTNTYGPTINYLSGTIESISGAGSDSKLDVSAFNIYSAGVRGDLNVITGNTAALSTNTATLSDKILDNFNNINSVSAQVNTINGVVIPEVWSAIYDVSGDVGNISADVANKLDTTSFQSFYTGSYAPNMNSLFSGIATLSSEKEDKITWEYNNDGEISAANGSALAGKGYYSKYAPYGVTATSGNLIIEGTRYPRQSLLEVSGENNVATAGIIPPVPEQNLSAVRYLVAASGSLADVSWAELPQIDTFSGVTTDSTLTGDGKNDPLGVAEVQSLTSDNSISITSGDNEVILGVNSSWFDNAVNSAFTGAQGDVEVNTYVHNNSATINEVNTTVQSNSASWSQGTTYSSVSGTVIVSGSDLEISCPAIKTGVPWIADGWSHSYDDSTAFNAGFQKQYNSYRLTHYMYNRQYPNSSHTGFSATLLQQDENYNVLSSTQLNGIFDFEFTPVPNCDMIWLYCSGTSAECQRGVYEYYRDGNSQKWVENLAWENDTPTRNEFANLYENIAVNSGSWSEGTSIDFHYIEV